jgi:hypothetical protein
MTTGFSGSFSLNGTTFIMQPTTATHDQRDNMGFDGNGHPVYPSVRSFKITWNLMHPTDAQQIINAYNAVQNTGTVSFDLPFYGDGGYQFKCYSGCTIEEPEFGEYYMGYITDGKLIIHNVRT